MPVGFLFALCPEMGTSCRRLSRQHVQFRGQFKPSLAGDEAFFDPTPIFQFCTDGERIVFGERFGPNMVCRKAGSVVVMESGAMVSDILVLWGSSTA
jgi:hypothetical protein